MTVKIISRLKPSCGSWQRPKGADYHNSVGCNGPHKHPLSMTTLLTYLAAITSGLICSYVVKLWYSSIVW